MTRCYLRYTNIQIKYQPNAFYTRKQRQIIEKNKISVYHVMPLVNPIGLNIKNI